jgi:hypothetical protein
MGSIIRHYMCGRMRKEPPSLFANRGGGTSCVLPFSGFLIRFNVLLTTNDKILGVRGQVGWELTTGLSSPLKQPAHRERQDADNSHFENSSNVR